MPVEHAGQHSPGHQTTPLRIRSWAGRLERDLPKVTQGHWTPPAYWEPQVPDSALHVPRLYSQRPGKPLSPGKVRARPTVAGAWLLARRVFTELGTFPATDLGAEFTEKTEAGDSGVTLARTRRSEQRG